MNSYTWKILEGMPVRLKSIVKNIYNSVKIMKDLPKKSPEGKVVKRQHEWV